MENVPVVMFAPAFDRCFLCNQLTPAKYLRQVAIDGCNQAVCVACYRRLMKRVQELEIEELKWQEDEEFSDAEAEAAFGSPKPQED